MECDWKNTGGYWSGAEVIDIRIPQLHPLGKSHIVSLGVACALFLKLRALNRCTRNLVIVCVQS